MMQVEQGVQHGEQERIAMLASMQQASSDFYRHAVQIGCHPFIEFAGLMNEYIKCCAEAHKAGIDFATCNTHTGQQLPIPAYSVAYINEKLECIFTGRSVMSGVEDGGGNS